MASKIAVNLKMQMTVLHETVSKETVMRLPALPTPPRGGGGKAESWLTVHQKRLREEDQS